MLPPTAATEAVDHHRIDDESHDDETQRLLRDGRQTKTQGLFTFSERFLKLGFPPQVDGRYLKQIQQARIPPVKNNDVLFQILPSLLSLWISTSPVEVLLYLAGMASSAYAVLLCMYTWYVYYWSVCFYDTSWYAYAGWVSTALFWTYPVLFIFRKLTETLYFGPKAQFDKAFYRLFTVLLGACVLYLFVCGCILYTWSCGCICGCVEVGDDFMAMPTNLLPHVLQYGVIPQVISLCILGRWYEKGLPETPFVASRREAVNAEIDILIENMDDTAVELFLKEETGM